MKKNNKFALIAVILTIFAILYISNQKFLATSVFPNIRQVSLCSFVFGEEIIPPPKGTFLPETRINFKELCYTERLLINNDWRDCEQKTREKNEDSRYIPNYRSDDEEIGQCVAQLSKNSNLCTKLLDPEQFYHCTQWRDHLFPPPTTIPAPISTTSP